MPNEPASPGGVRGFFAKAMPWLSAAAPLGGPAAVLAAGVLGKVLGSPGAPAKVAPTTNGIMDALSKIGADQALIEKGKEADQQFQLQLEQLGIKSLEDMEQIAAADRASARNREIQIKDSTPKILAAVVIFATIAVEAYCAIAVFHHQTFDAQGAIIVGRILGMLDTSVGLVLAYYFGSSAGSAAKTQVLNDIAAQK